MTSVKHFELPLCLKDTTQKVSMSCFAFALQCHCNRQRNPHPLRTQFFSGAYADKGFAAETLPQILTGLSQLLSISTESKEVRVLINITDHQLEIG